MARKSKKTRIQDEKTRLEKLYEDLPERDQIMAAGLIENAAFMRAELAELAEDISKNGWTELFSQGNQAPYSRARPAGQTYTSLEEKYKKTMDSLRAMLPPDKADLLDESDGFDDFVLNRDGP